MNLFIPEAYEVSSDQIQKSCNAITQCSVELNIIVEPISKPYAQPFEEQISILIEGKIPVFSYTFGTLDPKWISKFKQNYTVLISTATTLAEAQILEKSGIDAIIAQGSEAGGHRGTFLDTPEKGLIELFSLLPQLVENLTIPIIAAGAIMDGKGIVAALNLGAGAVQMGTAFLSCVEAGIPQIYKQTLLEQQQDNTVLTHAFSGKLARGIRNQFIDCMENNKNTITDYPVQNVLTTTMRQKAKEENNSNFMSLWAGQSATLCRNLTASRLIMTLVAEIEVLSVDKPK